MLNESKCNPTLVTLVLPWKPMIPGWKMNPLSYHNYLTTYGNFATMHPAPMWVDQKCLQCFGWKELDSRSPVWLESLAISWLSSSSIESVSTTFSIRFVFFYPYLGPPQNNDKEENRESTWPNKSCTQDFFAPLEKLAKLHFFQWFRWHRMCENVWYYFTFAVDCDALYHWFLVCWILLPWIWIKERIEADFLHHSNLRQLVAQVSLPFAYHHQYPIALRHTRHSYWEVLLHAF